MNNSQATKTIAIIGASSDRTKYGNKAVRAYLNAGYRVFPINPQETEIEGQKCYSSLTEVPETIETASFYVRPKVAVLIVKDLKEKGIKQVYVNPGVESPELIEALQEAHIEGLFVCSIRDVGEDPSLF